MFGGIDPAEQNRNEDCDLPKMHPTSLLTNIAAIAGLLFATLFVAQADDAGLPIVADLDSPVVAQAQELLADSSEDDSSDDVLNSKAGDAEPVASVPEPGITALIGFAGFLMLRRRFVRKGD